MMDDLPKDVEDFTNIMVEFLNGRSKNIVLVFMSDFQLETIWDDFCHDQFELCYVIIGILATG